MTTSQGLQDRFQRNVVFSLRVALSDGTDPLAAVVAGIRDAGGRVGQMELAGTDAAPLVYDLQVFAASDEQMDAVRSAVQAIDGVELLRAADLAMETHRGGACEIRSRSPILSNTDLRIVYTPGVARVCKAIQAEPARAREFTNLANKVAVATNGTAILGLGDIGPLAGLPVMEGKAAIFWEFAGVSAEPVLVDTHDADEFIFVMEKLAPGFGAIQIEDVKAPECFRITRELDRRLDIPVFHDDQHGTATIVLAGVYSALKKTGKRMADLTVAISGAGAAGTAIADLLTAAGAGDIVLCDRAGILHRGREENMNPEKRALAERTNAENLQGALAEAMAGRELFIGVSQPNLVSGEMVRSMAPEPLVFALANPVSEITPAEAYAAGAAVAADGRMMNNALAYPGIFRGALDAAPESITMDMMMAAADTLASLVPAGELMPEMMDPKTHRAVADAVKSAAK
jgi:malate dehydrogenase (oxaloacetate-decarboxylating)